MKRFLVLLALLPHLAAAQAVTRGPQAAIRPAVSAMGQGATVPALLLLLPFSASPGCVLGSDSVLLEGASTANLTGSKAAAWGALSVLRDGASVGTPAVAGDGTWSLNSVALSEPAHVFTVFQAKRRASISCLVLTTAPLSGPLPIAF